jgi:ectoine hydroxylase-related dioxygenase (phytanoyl-CoA dioxygenase family)
MRPAEPTPAESGDAEAFDALARAVREDGFAVLRAALEPELVGELLSTVDRLLEQLRIPRGANTFLGHHTRRIFNLLARDPVFAQVPLHPAVLSIVERVLDPECLLSSLTAVEVAPGQAEQPFHADDGSLGLPRPHAAPLTCSAIWALTDFSARNGATRIVAGSHRFDRRPRKGEQPEFAHVEMPAGSVLIYHGSLWHAGGANRSDACRALIVCNYCAGFLRQEENQLLALSRELVATFPPRLRALVGYSTYRGLLGHVDQRSPAALLDPEAPPTEMVWARMR